MSFEVEWDTAWDTGLPGIDAEHRAMLGLCTQIERAARAPAGEGRSQAAEAFETLVDRLKALVREHLPAEAALLVQRGTVDPDDAGEPRGEFDELVDEVATPDHFDAVERHRFVAVWCMGHVAESARQLQGEAE